MYIYADNAATTKTSQAAIDAMVDIMNNVYGNPSSLHTVGQKAKEALEKARVEVAQCLGADFKEIYFTSGGSEADNQAIISAAKFGARKNKKHIISTKIEHHAVLHTWVSGRQVLYRPCSRPMLQAPLHSPPMLFPLFSFQEVPLLKG